MSPAEPVLSEHVGEIKLSCRRQWDNKLLYYLQVEDSIMERRQISLIHGDVINDNRIRSGCYGNA